MLVSQTQKLHISYDVNSLNLADGAGPRVSTASSNRSAAAVKLGAALDYQNQQKRSPQPLPATAAAAAPAAQAQEAEVSLYQKSTRLGLVREPVGSASGLGKQAVLSQECNRCIPMGGGTIDII